MVCTIQLSFGMSCGAVSDPSLQQGAYSQYYPGFDPSFRIDPSASFVPPPHSPPDSCTKQSVSSNDVHNHTKLEPASVDEDDGQYHDPTVRSSSEEKESLTPAQSKRKAQNRAAYVPRFPLSLPPTTVHSGALPGPPVLSTLVESALPNVDSR